MGRQPFTLRYTPALDGLRGCAVLCVLAFHLDGAPLPGGFIGVDLFFCLSGFLITMLLLQERDRTGRISLKRFFVKRALRLLPVLVVSLAMVGAVGWGLGYWRDGGFERFGLVAGSTLGYVANWALALGWFEWPKALRHVWSLAIEEQFYLGWPLLCAGLLKGRAPYRTVLACAVGAAALSATWRAYLTQAGEPFGRVYFGTDTRLDGLLLGCTMAVLVFRLGLPRALTLRWIALGSAAAFLSIATRMEFGTGWVGTYGFALANVASCGLVLGMLRPSALQRLLAMGPLVALGRISYGLYLWHWPVYLLLISLRVAERGSVQLAMTQVVLSVAVAALSYQLVEKPFLRWKSRIAAT